MIKVEKKTFPDDTQWIALLAEANAARDALIAGFDAGDDIKVNDKLYKKYVAFLERLFHKKCAYCESSYGQLHPVEVEHYRPKGRVMGDDGNPVEVDHPVKGHIRHPGYYWLAYDWANLFPSCIDCNRARRHGTDKAKAGKADRFPVDGFRAIGPGDEKKERALLLNPSESDPALDPAMHLEFEPDGTVKGKTDIGTCTIRELGLNLRETLVAQRRLAYSNARMMADTYLQAQLLGMQQRAAELQPQVDAIRGGTAEYSAVCRTSYNHVIDEAARRINAIAAAAGFGRP